jgi:hypothetical protein
MTNLLTTNDGRAAATVAKNFLLQRRLSRFFKSRLPISVEEYLNTGVFDIETLLGELNEAHDAEILTLYHLLGLSGGLSQTVSDIQIYVDGTTGDDETGDGTAANPYKTLWFMSNLPKTIAHSIVILISGTVGDGTQDLIFDQTFTGDGSINIIGVGAPEVIAGPFTITANDLFASACANALACNVIAGADYAGHFARMKTGADINRVAAIEFVHPTIQALFVPPAIFDSTVPTDEFDVVRPAPKLAISNLIGAAKGYRDLSTFEERASRISFCNLQIELTVQGPVGPLQRTQQKFVWRNLLNSQFTFCQVTIPGAYQAIFSGDINNRSAIFEDMESLSSTGITNLNNGITGATPYMAGLTFRDMPYSVEVRGTHEIHHVFGNGIWVLESAVGQIKYCFGNYFDIRDSIESMHLILTYGHVSGGAYHNGAGFVCKRGHAYIESCSVAISDNLCAQYDGGNIATIACDLDPTYTSVRYCYYIEGTNLMEVQGDVTNQNGVPTINGVVFQMFNPAAEDGFAIPAVDAFQFNTAGSCYIAHTK